MSQQGNRPKLREKGLLMPSNCVLALIDLQPQMLFGGGSADRQAIVNHNTALAAGHLCFTLLRGKP